GEWASATGRPVTVVTLDLDLFKEVNDSYGHAAGDAALQVVACTMRSVAGEDDVPARLGGDEFVLLLRADQKAALRTVEQIRTTWRYTASRHTPMRSTRSRSSSGPSRTARAK